MFAVKFFNDKGRRNDLFNRSVSTIASFLKGSLNRDVNIISDSSTIEMVSDSLYNKTDTNANKNVIVAELLIKKTVIINTNDLEDREKLDRYLSEIRHFCEQAVEIEDISYLPLHLRELK